MVLVKNKAFRIIPNKDVASGSCRLRNCEAKTLMERVERDKIHPGDVINYIAEKMHHNVSVLRSNVEVDQNFYEFTMWDTSTLVWVAELECYAIRYPVKCKAVIIPKEVPAWKDKIGQGSYEPVEKELIEAIEKALKKTHNWKNIEVDDDLEGFEHWGCG